MRAVGRRGARAELARLRDRAARQLDAADPGREAEVVLDPARGAGLAAQRRALDDERVEALRGAVDRGAEAGRAAADHDAGRPPRAARARARCRARATSSPLVGLRSSGRRAAARAGAPRARGRRAAPPRPGRRRARVAPVWGRRLRLANSTIRRVGAERARPDDLDPDPVELLERLAPRHERRQQQVGQRAVLEQQRPQRVAVDGDVAHRLRDDRGQEHRLARQQVHLAEEARRAVADDLVCRRRPGSPPRPRGSR